MTAQGPVGRTRPVVVFDGDDTLWVTEPLYDRARTAAGAIVAREGLSAAAWDALERELDVQNYGLMGAQRERFPTSCVQAYERVSLSAGQPPSPTVSREVYEAAASVFDDVATIIPGAHEVLHQLREHCAVVLFTKGDLWVQQRRIIQSGLEPLFTNIYIRQEKTPRAFRSIVRTAGGRPRSSWSIGNSLKSDIAPALSIGMRAILIWAPTWEYERSQLPIGCDVIRANSLREIPSLIGEASASVGD